MERTLHTKYGSQQFECRRLHGTAVLYLKKEFKLRKGALVNSKPLAQAVRLREGAILMPRKPQNGEVAVVPEGQMFWQIFRHGLYDALRWAVHVDVGYSGDTDAQGEVRQLEGAEDALARILAWLDASPVLDPDDHEALRGFLRDAASGLGRVKDERKVRAVLRLLAARTEQDCLNRRNPSARMARMAGAAHDLQCRVGLIRFIMPRIGQRAIAMTIEADRIQRVFKSAYKELGVLLNGLRRGIITSRALWSRLDVVIARLESVRIGPYPAHIKRICSDLDIARKRKRQEERARYLTRARESLRFKKARWVLEEILMRLSAWVHSSNAPSEFEVAAMSRELSDFRGRLAGLDESGFTVKTLPRVGELLDEGVAYLLPNRAELRKAKRLIQQAAQRL